MNLQANCSTLCFNQFCWYFINTWRFILLVLSLYMWRISQNNKKYLQEGNIKMKMLPLSHINK